MVILVAFISDPCEEKKCSFNALCVVNRNYKASCRCPKCPPATKPVCGSDGETYINECELRKQSCTTKTSIKVLYQGKCGEFYGWSHLSSVFFSFVSNRRYFHSCAISYIPSFNFLMY